MKKQNLINLLFIIGVVLFLLGNTAVSFKVEDMTFSYVEKRMLKQLSAPTVKKFMDGTWFSEFEVYCKDHFWLREQFMKEYYGFLDTLHIYERNGYVLGKDGFLMPVNEHAAEEKFNLIKEEYGVEQADKLKRIKEAADEVGSRLVYVNIPSKQEIYPEKYTKYGNRFGQSIWV